MVAAADAALLLAKGCTDSAVLVVVTLELESAGPMAAVCVAVGSGPASFNAALDASAGLKQTL